MAGREDWDRGEELLWTDLLTGDEWMMGDAYAADLFDKAFFDPSTTKEERESSREALIDYLWNEYEIDFEEAFDWEDYRDWYDSA